MTIFYYLCISFQFCSQLFAENIVTMTNASLKNFFGFIFPPKNFGVKAECLIVAKVKKNHMLCLEKNENLSKFFSKMFFSKTYQILVFFGILKISMAMFFCHFCFSIKKIFFTIRNILLFSKKFGAQFDHYVVLKS